jgi:hypothetical protein
MKDTIGAFAVLLLAVGLLQICSASATYCPPKTAGMTCNRDPCWTCASGLVCRNEICSTLPVTPLPITPSPATLAPTTCPLKMEGMACNSDPCWTCAHGLLCEHKTCKNPSTIPPLTTTTRTSTKCPPKQYQMRCRDDPCWRCDRGLYCAWSHRGFYCEKLYRTRPKHGKGEVTSD